MQDNNGIATNEGTALHELSLDEAEMVGGGFGFGGNRRRLRCRGLCRGHTCPRRG
jgi:hypothetical protein